MREKKDQDVRARSRTRLRQGPGLAGSRQSQDAYLILYHALINFFQ